MEFDMHDDQATPDVAMLKANGAQTMFASVAGPELECDVCALPLHLCDCTTDNSYAY